MSDELSGKRILVVEDEPILAMCVEDMLRDMGCIVVGPALRLDEAEILARSEAVDGAVLDVNMGEGLSFPVADILLHRKIPFCFSTGYGEAGIALGYEMAPVLQKPYREDRLITILRQCLATGASGRAAAASD